MLMCCVVQSVIAWALRPEASTQAYRDAAGQASHANHRGSCCVGLQGLQLIGRFERKIKFCKIFQQKGISSAQHHKRCCDLTYRHQVMHPTGVKDVYCSAVIVVATASTAEHHSPNAIQLRCISCSVVIIASASHFGNMLSYTAHILHARQG